MGPKQNQMNKTLLFLALLISLASRAQIINIPDAALKAKLLSASLTNNVAQNALGSTSIDLNTDGEIQQSEALLITNLNLESSGISSLEGLQYFQGLMALNVDLNDLVTIDLETMPALIWLSCRNNDLTTINLAGLEHLVFLSASNNLLSNLNVGLCPALAELRVDGNPITTSGLTGLSTLSNLTLLWLGGYPVGNVDLTGLANLQNLSCTNASLTALNLTPVPNLNILDCRHNQLSALDLPAVPHLMSLYVEDNTLSSLDVSMLPQLTLMSADDNPLMSLTLSGSALHELSLSSVPLTTLDVSQVPTLVYFTAHDNQFFDLDFSAQLNLQVVSLTNSAQLHSLNVKNGATETNYDIFNCPDLAFICADEADLAALQSVLNQNGLNSASLNTYCSFTPGGVFNTVVGTVRYDMVGNGCGVDDDALSFFKIGLTGSAGTGNLFTNGSGSYILPVQQTNTTLTPVLENPQYFTVSPTVTTVTFATIDGSQQTKDFCVTANGQHNDVEIVIATIGPARPGFDATYNLVFHNKGTTANSGQITFGFDDSRIDFVSSSIAVQQYPGQLVFDYADLNPFETRSISIVFNVNAPTEIPAVNIGDYLPYTAQIAITGVTDEVLQDNAFNLNQVVIGAMDPNNKICLEGDFAAPSQIGKYLHYIINFENTGNASAENIVVKDLIDAAKFDLASLQTISSSHEVQTRMSGNKVEFIFDDIQLAAGAHGHVIFKVKTKNTLTVNSVVTNKADIFFDYNFPITTNTATTTFQLLGTQGFETDSSIGVYPNPAANVVNVKASVTIESMELFDGGGRVLSVLSGGQAQKQIDVSKYASGIYYIKVKTEQGSRTVKLIKR